ncbi:MAG TPA: hypothetical protein VID72_07095, partial [Ktedonobacterales bacterium]
MPGILKWLFTDPVTAGSATSSGNPEVFHFYALWIIFCALALIVPIYYYLEGRKRFTGHHALNKYILDRILLRQLIPVALVGWLLIGMRYAMDYNLFSWRIWRYMWLLWVAGLAIYWIYYFSFRYA